MATTANDGHPVGWTSRLTKARLHFVSGKGGTGKSTVAAALALTLAAGGRKVLLVEVEERQGIAQLFDVPPLPYKEQKVATAEGGGEVRALAIDIEAAFLEYLDMFYNLGHRRACDATHRRDRVRHDDRARSARRAAHRQDQGIRGPRRQDKRPVYDAIVVDSPPTGRIARFLDVTKAVADLAKGGPVHSQSEGVVKLLHSELTAIHLVTLLEALPVQETAEAIEDLRALGLPIGSVIVNRNIPAILQTRRPGQGRRGVVDADAVRADLTKAGITLPDADFAGLLTETIEHATRIEARSESAEALDEIDVPRLELPAINDGSTSAASTSSPSTCTAGSPMMSTTPRTLDMASILADRSNRVVVCCGAGGVGKTTTAAPWRYAPPSTGARSWC